jgi:hypothetical protein
MLVARNRARSRQETLAKQIIAICQMACWDHSDIATWKDTLGSRFPAAPHAHTSTWPNIVSLSAGWQFYHVCKWTMMTFSSSIWLKVTRQSPESTAHKPSNPMNKSRQAMLCDELMIYRCLWHLLSLYLSVKRSHHVRRESLEILTLIQKRKKRRIYTVGFFKI